MKRFLVSALILFGCAVPSISSGLCQDCCPCTPCECKVSDHGSCGCESTCAPASCSTGRSCNNVCAPANCNPCCAPPPSVPCYYYPSRSNPCFCPDIDIAIEALIWKPCVNNTQYAAVISGAEDTKIKYKSVCPDWEAGIRGWWGLPCFYRDWGIKISYTYVDFCDSSSIKKENQITSPLPHESHLDSSYTLADAAKANWEGYYHEWDVRLTKECCCGPYHRFTPVIAIAGIILDHELDVALFDGSSKDKVEWDSRYWGVGLRAGTDYDYLICPCLHFVADAHVTVLAGGAKNESEHKFDTKIETDDDDCCLIVPGIHIGAGFVYDTSICDCDVSLKLGYEFIDWWNLPTPRVFVGENATTRAAHATSGTTGTFGFHGLYAGIGMSF